MRPSKYVLLSSALFFLTTFTAKACGLSYIVQRGDTLSAIAEAQLGSVFKMQKLHNANRGVIGRDPDLIRVGQTLAIPCDTVSIDTVDWSVMPEPSAVHALMARADIQVLDIRSVKAVSKGVVPGAVSVPFKNWRGPKDNPGAPPSEATLSALIGAAGLDISRPIVVVHNKPNPMDMGRAALVYWLLKSSGAKQLAILRGGHAAWAKAGLPTDAAPRLPAPRSVKVRFSREWRADEVDVYGIATFQIEGHLMDARPHKFVSRLDKLGKVMATTLPGAQNIPASPLMSRMMETDPADGVVEVVNYLRENDVDWQNSQVVSFCNTGELAALNWFYSSELAGLPGFRLFPESVKGWSADGGKLFAPAAS